MSIKQIKFVKTLTQLKHNSKKAWQRLGQWGAHHRTVTELPPHLSMPEEISNSFVSVSKSMLPVNQDILHHYQNNCVIGEEKISFGTINGMDVSSAIAEIKSRAMGIDNIGLSMLIFSLPFIINFLVKLFDDCLGHGWFPEVWKSCINTLITII